MRNGLVRRLRHWKQRFNQNAEFVWRKQMTFGGETVKPGQPIPQELKDNPVKLRRFWESRAIELAEFDEPNVATGVAAEPVEVEEVEGLPGVTLERKGRCTVVTTARGEKIKVDGKKKLNALLSDLRTEADDEEEDTKWMED